MNRVDLETELALALIDELTPELDRMEIEHADTMDAMRERINELKDGVK